MDTDADDMEALDGSLRALAIRALVAGTADTPAPAPVIVDNLFQASLGELCAALPAMRASGVDFEQSIQASLSQPTGKILATATAPLNANQIMGCACLADDAPQAWASLVEAVVHFAGTDGEAAMAMLGTIARALPAIPHAWPQCLQARWRIVHLLAQCEEACGEARDAAVAASWWALPDEAGVTLTGPLLPVAVTRDLLTDAQLGRWNEATAYLGPMVAACRAAATAAQGWPPGLGWPIFAGGAVAWAARFALHGTGAPRNPSPTADVDVFTPCHTAALLQALEPVGVVGEGVVLTLHTQRGHLIQLVPVPVGLPEAVLGSFDMTHAQGALDFCTGHLVSSARAAVAWLTNTTAFLPGRTAFPARILKAVEDYGLRLLPGPGVPTTSRLTAPEFVAARERRARAAAHVERVRSALRLAPPGASPADAATVHAWLQNLHARRALTASDNNDWSCRRLWRKGGSAPGVSEAAASFKPWHATGLPNTFGGPDAEADADASADASAALESTAYSWAEVPWMLCERAAYAGRVWGDVFGPGYVSFDPPRDRSKRAAAPYRNYVRHVTRRDVVTLLTGCRLRHPCPLEETHDFAALEVRVDSNNFAVVARTAVGNEPLTPEDARVLSIIMAARPMTFGLPVHREVSLRDGGASGGGTDVLLLMRASDEVLEACRSRPALCGQGPGPIAGVIRAVRVTWRGYVASRGVLAPVIVQLESLDGAFDPILDV